MNNNQNPTYISDNIQSGSCVTRLPVANYTVLPGDNVIVCGANSLAITLNASSNSPVWITSIEGTTQHTGCTIVVGSQDFVIADGGCGALCVRIAGGSDWMIVGAKTAS